MISPGAVFLSYASQDADTARRLAESLRRVGLEVWFDQDELRGGDEWDRKIRQQIRTCTLFVPLISAHTQARTEGYFRLEWHLAEQRSLLMAKGRAFIVPVCVDTTAETGALVPDAFLAVQWSRPTTDAKLEQFVAQVERLLTQPLSSSRPSGAAAAPRPTAAAPTALIPDYELLRQVGRGSYGDVWLARGVTGILRAVKIVWRERFADAEPFEREFKGLTEFAAISLGESIQLALLHVGRNDEAGFFYYVMELADDAQHGRAIDPERYTPLTLSELRRRRGRVQTAEAVAFGLELARALAALHARGLVHRDIKPSNVILVNGVPKLADIGLVAPAASARTFVGTEGYVPPEGPGSPAADVYALGKVLYELVTGLDRQQFPQLPTDLNQLPDRRALMRLNAVILRACEAQPAQRYRDAAALLADLQALQSGRRVRRFALWPIAAACGIGLALAAGWAWLRPSAPAPGPVAAPEAAATSVAVLPFVDLSGGKEQESLCDGLTVEILDALARERGLRVPGSSSSFSFKGAKVPAADVARTLKVEQLVEGTVQRSGSRLRIRVQLTRAADGFTESLGNFDREVTDSFALQDEVARTVVARITRRPLAAATAAPTQNPDAYGLYLRARALQTRSGNLAEEVAGLLSQAVAADPKFALAWARLAEARFRGFAGMTDRSPEVINGARTALDRALDLDPNLPEALIVRANWTRAVAGDFAAAQRDLDRAAALRPDTPDLRLAQSVLARDLGQWPEAVHLARETLALDPQNGDTTNSLGVALFAPRGQFAAADELFARAMAIQGPERLFPFRNRVLLRAAWRGPEAALRLADRAPAGQIGLELVRAAQLVALDRITEARALVAEVERAVPSGAAGSVAAFAGRQDTDITLLEAVGLNAEARRRAEEMRTDATRQFQRGNRAPLVRAAFVSAEIMLGHRESALAALEEWRTETERVPGARRREAEFRQFAVNLYARLGRTDDAIALLRETLADGFQPVRLMNPEVVATALRQDPRYQEIIREARRWADRQPDPADESPRPGEKTATSPAAADEKSIAVLPLENLSPEPANAPFTDGLHAEIVSTLQRISDLRVAPRQAVLPLKVNPKPLADVAREFGVAHVLTGSVRREGTQVRINLELVRAADGRLLWSNAFDREFRSSLAIHFEIADHVARLLQARGTAGIHAKQFLTKNPEVFERYLKVAQGEPTSGRPQDRVRELQELIKLDPEFMPAVSTLSQLHTQLSISTRDPKEKLQHAKDARRWAEEAARLLPGPFGDVARVFYYTRIEVDNARSIALAEGVVRALPLSGEAAFYLGQALMRGGRPAEALPHFQRVRSLNPSNKAAPTLELSVLASLRRSEEWLSLAAHSDPTQTAYDRFRLTGELAPVPADPKAAGADIWLLLHRRFDELLAFDDRQLARPGLADAERLALLQRRHRTLQALRRDEEAAGLGPLMISLGEKLAREPAVDPTASQRWLARSLVRTERVEEGLAIYRRYVDGASPTNQVQERWDREKELAEVYAFLGRPRECVRLLEHLLQVPCGLTVPMLQLSP